MVLDDDENGNYDPNHTQPCELEEIDEGGARNGSLVVPLDARVAEIVAEIEDLELDTVAEGAITSLLKDRPMPPGASRR